MARPTQGDPGLKTWLKRLAQLAATVGVTWFILDSVGFDTAALRDAGVAGWRPNVLVLAGATVLLLGAYVASAAIWGRIVVDLGGPRLTSLDSVAVFMVANLGRYVPGKVWQIAGLVAMAKGKGVPGVVATGAAVLGHGIALVAATLIGLAVLLDIPGPLRPWGFAAAAGAVALVVLIAIPSTFRSGVGLWFRMTRTEAPEALESLHGLRWLSMYLLNWLAYALSFWLLVVSFQADAPLVPIATAYAAAYVLGYLMMFAPAGVGVREGVLIVFLTPHLGVGPAGAIAVIARVWTTVVEVVPAAALWMRSVSGQPAGEAASSE